MNARLVVRSSILLAVVGAVALFLAVGLRRAPRGGSTRPAPAVQSSR